MASAGSVLMGLPDLIAGPILITAQGIRFVSFVEYQIPFIIAFYLGIAILLKGTYSLIFAFYGR